MSSTKIFRSFGGSNTVFSQPTTFLVILCFLLFIPFRTTDALSFFLCFYWNMMNSMNSFCSESVSNTIPNTKRSVYLLDARNLRPGALGPLWGAKTSHPYMLQRCSFTGALGDQVINHHSLNNVDPESISRIGTQRANPKHTKYLTRKWTGGYDPGGSRYGLPAEQKARAISCPDLHN